MLFYVLFWCWSCVAWVWCIWAVEGLMLRRFVERQRSSSAALMFLHVCWIGESQRTFVNDKVLNLWFHGVPCLCGVTMRDRSEQVCTDHFSAVLSINRLVFVPTDMFLKWNETRWGDKDLKSLCESNLKVPLRRLLLCSLMSGGAAGRPGSCSGRDGDTDRSCQGSFPLSLVFWSNRNESTFAAWRPGAAGFH